MGVGGAGTDGGALLCQLANEEGWWSGDGRWIQVVARCMHGVLEASRPFPSPAHEWQPPLLGGGW
jgi:hypothetical protein